jgi:hypothetical protein
MRLRKAQCSTEHQCRLDSIRSRWLGGIGPR